MKSKMNLYNNVFCLLLFLFLLSILLNSFSIIPFRFFSVEELDAGEKIRINHVLFIPFLIVALLGFRYIDKRQLIIFSILMMVVLYGSLATLFWWNNLYFINYLWAAACFLVPGCFHAQGLKKENVINIFLMVTKIFFLLVLIKNLCYISAFIDYINNPTVHPQVPSLTGGGVNIEATMLGMLTLFFFRDKKIFYLFIVVALVFSAFYASRAGILAVLLSLFAVSYYESKRKSTYILKVIVILVAMLLLLFILKWGDFHIADRFLAIGDTSEAGSRGRINMWRWIIPSLHQNILGYGIGNAVESIKLASGDNRFMDNNVHLYPMQVLLDFGLFGFIFYLCSFFAILYKTLTVRSDAWVFYAFVMIYLILGFIQFKGGEPLVYFIAGCALIFDRKDVGKNTLVREG